MSFLEICRHLLDKTLHLSPALNQLVQTFFLIDAKFHKNALKFFEILTNWTLQIKVAHWST